MLEIVVPAQEIWNEETQEFMYTDEVTLKLEHSLIALSKWESKWHKPFIDRKDFTKDETIDYIKCMCLKPVPEHVFKFISNKNIADVRNYIANPMTATTFQSYGNSKQLYSKKETLTSELIYYYMIALNIPFECEKWHLNRLMTLIRVCSIKNAPAKKMSMNETLNWNKALNAERKKKFGIPE